MQHNLVGQLGCICRIAFTPIITHRIRKNRTIPIERRRADGAAHLRVALETVFGVFVPEMKGAVTSGGAESAVDGVEGDGVYGIHV